jgi:hypothetical protein
MLSAKFSQGDESMIFFMCIGLYVLLVVVSPGISFAEPALTDAKPTTTDAKPTNAEALVKVRQTLDKPDDYDDLREVAKLLPLIFSTKEAQKTYFTGDSSLITPWGVVDNRIYQGDLKVLIDSLTKHAGRAARRGDLGRSRYALEIAVDAMILPTQLVPPEEVIISGQKVSGISTYPVTIKPAVTGLFLIGDVLKAIAAMSENNALHLKAARARATRIREELRSNAALKLSLLEKGQQDSPAYADIFRKELPFLQKELSALKNEISEGIGKITGSTGETMERASDTASSPSTTPGQ